MKTIWKFPLDITDCQTIKMPVDTTIISAQMQNNQLALWGIVLPDAPLEPRIFRIIGTGNPFPDPYTCKFIATIQDGSFVWHLFEKTN